MTLNQRSRKGNQEPRIKIHPQYEYSSGDIASKFAHAIGYTLDEWQDEVLRCWLSTDDYDRYVCMRNGLSVPRQNGKTTLVVIRCSFGAPLLGERVLYTAHEYSTVTETLEACLEIFGEKANDENANFPDLNAEVSRVRLVNGKEAIFFKNGGAIYFSTRTKRSKRGMTYDVVIFDEAQELTEAQLKSMMSTASSGPNKNPQFIFLGTPPGPEASGDVFPRIRKNVISGFEKSFSWFEWSVEKIGDIHDTDRWYETNPALGARLLEDVIEAEIGTLEELSFAQERLGYWLENSIDSILSKSMWEPLITECPPKNGKIAYGVKFFHDGTSVSLAVAVKPKDGLPHIELIECRSTSNGTAWLVNWLLERQTKAATVVVDGKAGAEALVERLKQEKFPPKALKPPSPKEVATAASFLFEAVKEERITHYDQEPLNTAALNAQKRPIGREGAWGWGGSGDIDATPIEACSLAYWGVMTTKRDPSRKAKVY